MDNEGSDELYLPGNGTWDYPLSRSEKLQRLLNMFEVDADHFQTEAEDLRNEVEELRQENSRLRLQLAAATATTATGVASSRRASKTPRQGRHSLRSDQGASTVPVFSAFSGDSSPTSSQESSPCESLLPTPPETPQDHICRELGEKSSVGSCLRPKLPGLAFDRLSPQVVATPRNYSTPAAEAAVSSTPRCFSIRTPPGTTPRVRSIVTPRSQQFLLSHSPADYRSVATPRSLSRICSIVTPRTGFGTPCGASAAKTPRHMATLRQLHEDRIPSDRGHEDGSRRSSDQDGALEDAIKSLAVVDQHASENAEDCFSIPCDLGDGSKSSEDEEMDAESQEASSEAAEDPEWMSFQTPENGVLADFEELWSLSDQDAPDRGAAASVEAPAPAPDATIPLSSEAIDQLIARALDERVGQAVAKALDEVRHGRTPGGVRPAPLRQGQTRLSRRPRSKRGERGELVADLARQTYASTSISKYFEMKPDEAVAASSRANNAELLRPVAQRLGASVARAGSAMQDAGRLAREAGAVVASRACAPAPPVITTLMQTPPNPPEACREKPPALEADAKTAKTKVVHAANAVKSKMLEKMPKGLRRRRKEDE